MHSMHKINHVWKVRSFLLQSFALISRVPSLSQYVGSSMSCTSPSSCDISIAMKSDLRDAYAELSKWTAIMGYKVKIMRTDAEAGTFMEHLHNTANRLRWWLHTRYPISNKPSSRSTLPMLYWKPRVRVTSSCTWLFAMRHTSGAVSARQLLQILHVTLNGRITMLLVVCWMTP